MKAILSQKYKGKVAEKIMSLFSSDLIVPLEYCKWIDLIEQLLNSKKAKLQWMAFNVLDFNEDDHVCQLDMFSIMKMYENEDDVFVKAYSHDICKIVAALKRKQSNQGRDNWDITAKLKKIYDKNAKNPVNSKSHHSDIASNSDSFRTSLSGDDLIFDNEEDKRSMRR